MRELVAYARAHPGKLNFGSAGIGNSAHLAAALFAQVAGIDMVHVPYKGNPLAMTDLNAGQIQVLFDPVQTTLPQIKGAACAHSRSPARRACPTCRRSPSPAIRPTNSPSGTRSSRQPARHAVLTRLNTLVNAVVRDAQVKQRFAAMGADLTESTPDSCAAMVRAQLPLWGKMFGYLGIKPE